MSSREAGSTTTQVEHATETLHPPRHATGEIAASIVPPGAVLGRYVVVGTIGRGAMGTVLRAYDPKLRREVALKLLRPDQLAAEGEARMVREAQAMARLSHPNVVAVYDVEVAAGSVMLAMELVQGPTLGSWLARGREWPEIIAVFRQAGAGLAAAHRAGLVHRDFKPHNVIIAPHGALGEITPIAKVTDFGLAKAADGAAPRLSLSPERSQEIDDFSATLTRGDVVIGTPRYMAPEQCIGEPAGEAADQYAFCVALWEALVGAPPFFGETMADIARKKLAGPPSWNGGRDVPRTIAVALRRGLAPAAKDRWPSMEALLAVLDVTPRRRRRLALALGVVGVAGATTLLVLRHDEGPCTGAAERIAEVWNDGARTDVRAAMVATALPYAESTASRVATRIDAWGDAWVDQHVDACTATQVRGEQSTEAMDLRMGCLQRGRASLATAIELLRAADVELVDRADELVDGLPAPTTCADALALRADVPPPTDADTAARVERARERLAELATRIDAGRWADARPLLLGLRDESEALGYAPLSAEIAVALGFVQRELGEVGLAEQTLALGKRDALQSGALHVASELAALLAETIGGDAARVEEARWEGELALMLARGREPGGVLEASAHRALARVHITERDWARAEIESLASAEQLAAALGPEHTEAVIARGDHATVLGYLGRPADAEAEHRRALALVLSSRAPDHPDVFALRADIANDLQAQGQWAEAAAEYREIIARRVEILGPDHPTIGSWHYNLGNALQSLRDYAGAEVEYRKAIDVLARTLGESHIEVATVRNNLANTLLAVGRLEQAEAEHRASLRIRLAALGPDNQRVAIAQSNVGMVLLQRDRPVEAEAEYRAATATMARALGSNHPDTGRCLMGVGEALLAQKRWADGIAVLRSALATMDGSPSHGGLRGAIGLLLAEAIWQLGNDRELARQHARTAREELARVGPIGASGVDEADQWLAAHP
ncbi:MAG TPA: serine/threonine-protein kinase [Nannocystaceae bacterium]|nr:serine/threonine-protein kinase [Nannocystaceae bacterium]